MQYQLVISDAPAIDATVCAVSGEIDAAVAPELCDALVTIVEQGRTVVVDLAAVTFMDASGVNCLLLAYHRAEDLGTRLRIRGATSIVRRVLSLLEVWSILAEEPRPHTDPG